MDFIDQIKALGDKVVKMKDQITTFIPVNL